MKTVICELPRELRLVDRPLPHAGDGDVLPRVRRIRLCCADTNTFWTTRPDLQRSRDMGRDMSGDAPVIDRITFEGV